MKATSSFSGELTSRPCLTFSWGDARCLKCAKALHVKVTKTRTVRAVAYGEFMARERQGYCPRHPRLPLVRSSQLARIVAPGARIAYDVVASIGMQRFMECRQYEEISIELSRRHGIEIPPRTLSYLAQKFVAYFTVVHQESTRRTSASR